MADRGFNEQGGPIGLYALEPKRKTSLHWVKELQGQATKLIKAEFSVMWNNWRRVI
jgi:hypothetical protein